MSAFPFSQIVSERPSADHSRCRIATRRRSLLLVLFALSLATPPASAATPEASLSVTFGPSQKAPLLAYFEATGSTDTDTAKPIHHLTYCFDAGDGNSAEYSLPGHKRVKKAQWCGGPQFAYVYEQPGTYTASVTVHDAQGNTDTETVSITVRPTPASETVCVQDDAQGTFSGCPSDATRKTEGDPGYEDFDNAVATGCKSFDRVLFQRGGEFSISATASISCSSVGTYGSGARTVLSGSSVSPVFYVRGDDRRVWGFDFTGNGTNQFATQDTGKEGDSDFVLFRDVAGTEINAAFILSTIGQGLGSQFTLNDVFGVFESEFNQVSQDLDNNKQAFFIGARRFALVGNRVIDSGRKSIVRLSHIGEDANGPGGGFVVANKIAGDVNASYTIRAAPNGTQHWGGDFWNENLVTADNWFDVNATVAIDFQLNKQKDEGFIKRRNHIFERNYITANPGVFYAMQWRDQGKVIEMTFRNNVVDLRGTDSDFAVAFASMGDRGWEIYNNSVLARASQRFWRYPDGPGCEFRNNVFWSTSGNASFFADGACSTQSNNWDTDGSGSGKDSGINELAKCPFKTCNPDVGHPADFQLGDELRDAGAPVPVRQDYGRRQRPAGEAMDVGAWEMGAVPFFDEDTLAAPYLH